MQKIKKITTGYRPRPLQQEAHYGFKRWNLLVCHRRFGKTVLGVNHLIDQSLRCRLERPRYAFFAPQRNQVKTVAWDYLKSYTAPFLQFGGKVNEAELYVEIPRDRRITLYGADNPDSLRGLYLDGVVLDEYAQMRPRVFSEIIRPALTDRNGWALFIGTPKGRNAFYDLYRQANTSEDWYAKLYKASETGIIPENELIEARKVMSQEQYDQEFECSFQAAVIGSYYGTIMENLEKFGQIVRAPWDPGSLVMTAWDLGIGDDTAIWFAQKIGREVRVIDYYENRGVGISHYVKILKEKPYVYDQHIFPHDADKSELGTGKRVIDTLRELGIRGRVLPRTSIEDGINAARLLLPQCYFDAEKCAEGIKALQLYRREYDDKRNTFSDRPLHDWTSHAADAFRYLAQGIKGFKTQQFFDLPKMARTEYQIFGGI